MASVQFLLQNYSAFSQNGELVFCQALLLNESVVAPSMAYDNSSNYVITLQNRLDYTGVAWITAAVIAMLVSQINPIPTTAVFHFASVKVKGNSSTTELITK